MQVLHRADVSHTDLKEFVSAQMSQRGAGLSVQLDLRCASETRSISNRLNPALNGMAALFGPPRHALVVSTVCGTPLSLGCVSLSDADLWRLGSEGPLHHPTWSQLLGALR